MAIRDKSRYITAEQFRLLTQGESKTKRRSTETPYKIRESDIRAAIKEFLEAHGWLVWINWQGPFSFRGLTDLTAIRAGEVWWIEVKRPGEYLSADQKRFRDLLEEHGGNWLLARDVEDVEHLARR